ncbi:MAG: glycosyltransferase family 2 protein [Actinomycetia bacterium]|nr:glycosyltransferase family 2 protein [Actinomycetes bacterium]
MIAVVVCTRDRPALLAESLAALAGDLGAHDERVVVDSASVDREAIAAVARAAGFRVVRVERPGLSRARNAGLAATTATVVAFTDDDCRVAPGWAAGVAEAFADESLGFLTGAVDADREARLPIAVGAHAAAHELDAVADPTVCGHGANMAFRRAALESVGGFDEDLGAGGPLRSAEDVDIFWRLGRAGWRGRHDPANRVTHVQWRSTAGALKISYGYGLGLGAMGVKGVRLGRREGWRVLGRGLWDNGVRRAWRDLRNGYQTGAASSLVRTGGVAVGIARGVRRPLVGERFS